MARQNRSVLASETPLASDSSVIVSAGGGRRIGETYSPTCRLAGASDGSSARIRTTVA